MGKMKPTYNPYTIQTSRWAQSKTHITIHLSFDFASGLEAEDEYFALLLGTWKKFRILLKFFVLVIAVVMLYHTGNANRNKK